MTYRDGEEFFGRRPWRYGKDSEEYRGAFGMIAAADEYCMRGPGEPLIKKQTLHNVDLESQDKSTPWKEGITPKRKW